MRGCGIIILPPMSLSPTGVSVITRARTVEFSSADADPIIKKHVMHWLFCLESYESQRRFSIEQWVLVYHDAETCLYVRPACLGCMVIIAFRGTAVSKDLYDDTLLSLRKAFPRSQQAVLFVRELFRLNPNLVVELTGHSLGGAVAREVGRELGLNVVTFNAAAPPSAPVVTGSNEIDYHIVFDIISAWQGPDTLRIDKGFRPLSPGLWGVLVPYLWFWNMFNGILPSHSLVNFSNRLPGAVVSSRVENDYMQLWFKSLPWRGRFYILTALLGVGSSFMSSFPVLA